MNTNKREADACAIDRLASATPRGERVNEATLLDAASWCRCGRCYDKRQKGAERALLQRMEREDDSARLGRMLSAFDGLATSAQEAGGEA